MNFNKSKQMKMVSTMNRISKQRKFRLEAGLSILNYVVINAFLAIVNWLTSPGYWWVLWVLAVWGLKLILGLIANYKRSQLDEEIK